MKRIFLFFFLLIIPTIIFGNVRGLRPIDGEYSWRVTGNLDISSANIRDDLRVSGNTYISGFTSIVGNLNFKNTVMISTEADFPAPSGDVITLEDNTNYVLAEPLILTTKRFVIPTGADVSFTTDMPNSVLVYLGADTMFTSVSPNVFGCVKTVFSAPSGTMFDIVGAESAASFIVFELSTMAAANLGRIHGITNFMLLSVLSGFSQGIEYQDNGVVAYIGVNVLNTANAVDCVWFTFKGIIPLINFSTLIAPVGSNETIFDFDSALITGGGFFLGINAVGTGTIFKSGSLDQTYPVFKFSGCVNIPDSTVKSKLAFRDNTTDTVIEDTDIPKKVNAVFTEDIYERFTVSTNGTATYTGLEDTTVLLSGSMFLEPALGVAKLLAGYFAKLVNGTYTVTFNNTTDVVNEVGHSRSNGDTIMFFNSGGALPAEIADDNFYYVVNVATDNFQISLTEGGAAVDFTDDGTGTNTYRTGEILLNSEDRETLSAATPRAVHPEDMVDIVTGDTLFMMVENQTDATDITVENANFLITRI
jgi:hypothetical protein